MDLTARTADVEFSSWEGVKVRAAVTTAASSVSAPIAGSGCLKESRNVAISRDE